MATGAPDRFHGGYALSVAPTMGRSIRRVGFVLLVAALVPVAVFGVLVLWVDGLAGIPAALSSEGASAATAFRIAVGGAAAGAWCVGLGLLIEGLYERER
jgi:hypothetical protein